MTQQDTGTAADGYPHTDVADFADLLPGDDNDADAAGGSHSGDDDQTPAALKKYGGDPAKLANAYSDLERKFGQQGQELGAVRQLVTALKEQMERLTGKKPDGSGVSNGEGDLESFMTELEEAEASGQIDIKKVLREMWTRMDKAMEQRQRPLQDALGVMNQASGYHQFVQTHPDAGRYAKLMKKLVDDRPYLLPETAAGPELQKRLGDLYLLCKGIDQEVRGGTGQSGKGSPDSGTTRRVTRRTSNNDQEISNAFDRFSTTRRDVDLAEVVKGVLAR